MATTQPKIGLSGYVPLRPSWDLNTKLQQSSKTWLREHGLERQHLTLEQILASTGFKQKKGFVKPLGREVSSRYAADTFFQQKSLSGELFNVVNKQELERKEKQLLTAIAKLKARLQWLTSGSRQACGAVTEASAVLLFHATSSPPAQLPILLAVAKGLVKEQFANITSFNIVRCQSDIDVFSDAGMVDSTSVFIQSGVTFLATTAQQGSKLGPTLPTSLQRALQLTSAQGIYVFVCIEVLLEHLEELKNVLKSSPVPVHFMCFINNSSQRNNTINCLKELCTATHGRYRIISTDKSSISQGICLEDHAMQEDNVVLEEELENAKDTLAEVQALLLEMNSKQTSLVTTRHVHGARKSAENSLTSTEWLKIHGLISKKLLFSELLASLAFRHCEAVFDLPTPPPSNVPSQVPSKLVGARYCLNLIHLRWPDGRVYHVSLSDVTASRYEQQVTDVVRSCEKRLEWLQRGSRKTFGILTVHKVVIVIDTSISMKENFQIVKDNLSLLFQEQLNSLHHYFTLVQCSSHTFSWREGLVPCTPQNLTAAMQWVQSLQAIGSTNIISALKVAIFVPSVEAIYLLTDGNSDQSITKILSELSQWPRVPVNTISFNHNDGPANKLLAQLAIATGGQFHSHHSTSPSGPLPYKTEDVELIENELALAKEQIEQARRFQEECKELRQQPPITVDLEDHDKPSEVKKKKKQVKTRSLSAKVRRDGNSLRNSGSTGSKHNMSIPSLQTSAASFASSPTHTNTRNPMSRPSSASSEHSHCSNSTSSSKLSSTKLGNKKNRSSERKRRAAKHYKVLAQCNNDGFYYPATVIGDDDSHHKKIKFVDESVQSVSNRHVIPTGGATARPFLQVGDHVLGRVRSATGGHISESGSCDYYVPATICVMPQQPSASYSLLAYNKRQVRCLRRDIIKITTERYKITARMIAIKLGTRRMSSANHKGSCDSITTPVDSRSLSISQDTMVMQQLLLEQQKQQTLLLNQQELLMGLQEGHKELMEKVQHKEVVDSHNSEREWWIKKLLQKSSMPTVQHKSNDTLRSQSFPSFGNSLQHHVIGYMETSVISNTTIGMHSQILNKERSPLNKALSFKEASVGETVVESPGLLAQSSVAVEACADTSPTHSPTYQSCGTNTHNLVDAGVNTAPLTVDICIGTDWSTSSSDSEEEQSEQTKTETSPQTVNSSDTSPQAKDTPNTSTTEKEPQSEDSVEMPSQPQATTTATSSTTEHSSYSELINQEVLARSIDGYYYWGVVLQYDHRQDLYIVEDLDCRQQLMMARSDFITETQDAARAVLQLYDRALAPRVLSPNCFLPGIVIGITDEGQYTVKLSDNSTSIRLRNEIYYLPIEIYDMNIEAIKVAQQQWLEQAVIARNDRDGFYYPGTVIEVTEHEQFNIERADGSRYVQKPVHVFGEYSRKLPLCLGDNVIALYNVQPNNISDDAVVGALPGKIIGEVEKLLAVEFCNGERFCDVDPLHCFWVHPNYYEHAQQFIIEKSK